MGLDAEQRVLRRLARGGLGLLSVLVLSSCRSSPVVLNAGSIQVTFEGTETCGFDNPYVADAKGCRLIDRGAIMCHGFGVIDGVLFAGGCEAAAEVEVLETRGTLPLSPSEPTSKSDGGAP